MTETTTFVKDTAAIRNGVDTGTMFATLDAIKAQPKIAQFRFRARNRWLGGRTARAPRPSPSTPVSPRSCWAPTRARTRPSTCCTPSPRASRPRWSTRPPRAGSG